LVEGATGGDTSRGVGQVQYQGQYGRYEAFYDSVVDRPVFTVSGGVVALGGSVHATRAIDDGFALIRTPGVSGMRGYVNNQEVGRTNGKGELVVPNNLISYYGNRISINDQDIPLDYRVDTTERTIAPPFRGGSLVIFPVRRLQILTGTLRIEADGELRVPTYGTLTVATQDGSIESPVGKNGEFYLENLDAGNHEAVVEYQTTTCSFILSVPTTPEPFVKLGEIRCGLTGGDHK
jgi:outer membrane usher protein